MDEITGAVSAFECANFADPTNRHNFVGRAFVLSLGGIEIPRLLLNCRDQAAQGIGNDRDLVGRFFMEHFHAHGGFYVIKEGAWPFGDEESVLNLSPTNAFMDNQRIGGANRRAIPEYYSRRASSSLLHKAKMNTKHMLCANDIIRDFVQSMWSFNCPKNPPIVDAAGYLLVVSEQVPNPDSRVFLTEETDFFGLRRAALDWRATDIDRRTIKTMVTAFGRYLASNEYGSAKVAEWLLDDDLPIPGIDDNWSGIGHHHIGTTRMAATPDDGVVDPNCGVFGIDNLYVAGSSVFPTGGHAAPTLSIVQLTLRLSDHLDRAVTA